MVGNSNNIRGMSTLVDLNCLYCTEINHLYRSNTIRCMSCERCGEQPVILQRVRSSLCLSSKAQTYAEAMVG